MKQLLPCLALALALSACTDHSPLHEAMEDMKGPFKTMRETDDAATIKTEFAAFKKGLEIAKVQKVKAEDQATFEEGMKELVALASQVEEALNAGNLQSAKELLQKMGGVRKEYHEKLGVK